MITNKQLVVELSKKKDGSNAAATVQGNKCFSFTNTLVKISRTFTIQRHWSYSELGVVHKPKGRLINSYFLKRMGPIKAAATVKVRLEHSWSIQMK